jgi:hypothetical protein
MIRWIVLAASVFFGVALVEAEEKREPQWKAGLAKVKITPTRPMWMSGYGGRDRPATGTLQDLWAKALVLQDPAGKRLVLVTMDLVGIPRDLSLAVCAELKKKHDLPREAILLSTSHTHCGPVVGSNLNAMYFLDAQQQKLVDQYSALLQKKLIEVVGSAFARLEPAELAWGRGHSAFAVNRRTNVENKVPLLRDRGELKGPVDHDVPVLSIRDADRKLRGVVLATPAMRRC